MLELRLNMPRRSFNISVDLQIPTHSIFCLFGPSATGKSSILSFIAGFEREYEDAYLAVDGKVLTSTQSKSEPFCPPWQRGIGYMEQSARLFPHLSVQQNILYGVPSARTDAWVEDMIDFLELRDYLSIRPQKLSGGLTQRVALARALAVRPRVLLLDEPFSALDWMSRRALQNLLLNVHRKFPTTIVLVTHQLSEAQRLADTIALIDQGRILQAGSPSALMESPSSWRVAQLLGYTALFSDLDGGQYAIHPDRTVTGRHPDLGISVEATICQLVWNEGHRRALVKLDSPIHNCEPIEVNLSPLDHIQVGERIPITFIHPPRVG